MASYTDSIEKLIDSLINLPGIGRRSAERIINYILRAPKEEVKFLSEAINKVKESVRFCRVCNNLSEEELCSICLDSRRQKEIVCIVGKPSDVSAIEKSGNY
ncbi:MAG: recombination protein RecR, partial [Candidatus Omnitrophota bacterium]